MHRGRAILQVSGALLAILSLVAVVAFTFKQPARNAHAADVSSTYTWKQLKAGGGGWITGIVAQPTTPGLVYGRADVGGLYKWNESTQSWTQLMVAGAVPNPTPNDYNVESVAVSRTNPNLVYAAVGVTWDLTKDAPNGRILKSTDQGKTWTDNGQRWKINGNADNRQESERLAIDPNNENVVYFGSRNMGLWRTTDGGNNWSQISTSQVPIVTNSGDTSPAGIKSVLFDATSGTANGVTQRIYATVSGSGVYVSNDGGNSWSNIFSTNQVIVAADVANNGNAYFSIGDSHMWRYTPSSNAWQDVSPSGNPNYLTISADPFNPQRLIAGTSPVSGGNLYLSTDSGASWTKLQVSLSSPDIPWATNSDEGNWLSVGNIIFDPQVQDRIWFGQGIGVWRADGVGSSNTLTFTFVSKGIEELVSTDMIAPPGGQPVTTNWDRQGFYHANPDQYPSHELMNNKFSSGWDLDYSGQNPQFLVGVISDHRFLNPDYSGYSTDGGQTWTQFSGTSTYNDRFAGNIAVSATDTNNIVWLPTYGRDPYVSTDRGATWNQLTFFNGVTGLHIQYYLSQSKILTSDKVDGSFYIYSSSGAFYRSTNSGQNWEKAAGAPTGGADAWVYGQIHAVPGHAGNVWATTAQGGLSYTEDKGDTWTRISAIQESHSFGFGAPLPGASYPTVYVHAKINNQWGIWRSSDKGTTWDLVSIYPMNIFDNVSVVNGDMNIPGRVYVGFGGNGFVYGDSGSSGGSGGGSFSTGFENGDAQPTWSNTPDNAGYPAGGVANISGVCCSLTGPEAGTRSETAHNGSSALMYSGYATNASGQDYTYMQVFDLSSRNITVGSNTTLEYWIYPQSSNTFAGASGNNSTCVAIDLIFSNGSNLRDSGATDQNGNQAHPAHQCNHLTLDTWNHVIVNLSPNDNGKTITRLDLGYYNANATGGYRGYVDDISIHN